MTFYEGLVIASGLAIGYWLVSAFTKSPIEHVEAADTESDDSSTSEQATSWHEVLGVSQWATQEEVTAAYREKIQQYHPDKVAKMGPEIRALAELKATQINEAYRHAKQRS